jgi:sugar O-acyltransferase (sialic acid O-acetyltransferase NeuD family)
MEDIYILGSGGFAKEVYFLIKEISEFEVIAFIDTEAKNEIVFSERSIPVISEEHFLSKNFKTKPKLAMGIGNPKLICKLGEKFKSYDFPNLIHPNAVLDKNNISFGRGNIITAGVIMTTSIAIGDFNIFNLNTTVGHDAVIGDGNIFNPGCNISGETIIGSYNLFGVNATVLQQLSFGSNSILGASGLLTKDGEDNGLYIGMPAKKIKDI